MITPDLGLTHFNSIYIILLCSWSYGVLLWEMETGGVSSFLDVFLQSFLYHFILIVLPLSSFLLLLNSICLLRLPKVRMLLQSYARLIFFLFFSLVFAFSPHIFTTRPQTISWFDNHRIDVRVEERLPTGKAQRMFG